MVQTREEAAKRAEASKTNTPSTCQLWTRNLFGAPSAGDQDRDGDNDAVDGWISEPAKYRHSGDRNPPRGVPVAWSGGSKGYGHRAISLGKGKIRSTDAGGSGKVATVDIGWFESHWGMRLLGWSDTISGLLIPGGGPTTVSSKWASGDVYLDKLRRGQDDSDSVRRLQYRLRNLKTGGSPNLPVTGNYFHQTVAAVKKWQALPQVSTGANDGISVTGPQSDRLFGEAYKVIK